MDQQSRPSRKPLFCGTIQNIWASFLVITLITYYIKYLNLNNMKKSGNVGVFPTEAVKQPDRCFNDTPFSYLDYEQSPVMEKHIY